MKRMTSLVLAALVFLCGCAAGPDLPAPPPATAPTPATEPAGIYDHASEIEAKTHGAVKVYPLGLSDASAIAAMGSDLLLFSGAETTTLTRYRGDDLCVAAAASLNCRVRSLDGAVRISEDAISYYDEMQKELVLLDAALTETTRFPLPETIYGAPALSQDRKMLYYSTSHALHSIDLTTGLDRLLKEVYDCTLVPMAVHCDGAVIACSSVDTHGNRSNLYICARTGQLLHESSDDLALQTFGDSYFAQCKDGVYTELLLGSSEHGPTLLSPHTYNAAAFPLLSIGGAVLSAEDTHAGITQLDYYDLSSGKRTSSITLDGAEEIRSICAASPERIWFLRYDVRYGCDVLYCWNPAKSEVTDSYSCLSARYTAQNPDLGGLAACREIADRLSDRYGVQIHLWTDATAFQPWDYTLVPEYQVRVISENLKELERFLALYPDGFLATAAQMTSSGRIQICLVRSILGKEDTDGTLSEAVGLQFWDDNRNSYLCLSMEPEQLFRNACHEMSHIIDSRVLTFCKAYDDWNNLNPPGFQYTYDYSKSLSIDNSRWTEGEARAFIDVYSTSFPREDRARIMEYAITDGNDAYFASDTMQKKLRVICLGIRQAFGLENASDSFLWEQYLKQPLKK